MQDIIFLKKQAGNKLMLSMRFLIWLKGHFVGEDELGNRYYEERFLFSKPNRPPRRWVWYKNEAEPSKIPPQWYGWIHFTYEGPLTTTPYPWQESHQENTTGTTQAYYPDGSLYKRGPKPNFKRYKSWSPND